MDVHRIRLGSAWRLFAPVSAATATIIDLPARGDLIEDWPSDGSFEMRRNFNRPSNLDDDQVVKLAFTGLAKGARITLNGSPLVDRTNTAQGNASVLSFTIGKKLLPQNELRIVFGNRNQFSNSNIVILESVMLEIETTQPINRD